MPRMQIFCWNFTQFLRISPIAWNHIIFTGRYNFKNNNTKVDLEKMIVSLEEKLRNTLWKNSYKL